MAPAGSGDVLADASSADGGAMLSPTAGTLLLAVGAGVDEPVPVAVGLGVAERCVFPWASRRSWRTTSRACAFSVAVSGR
jgi:hypothetical protein